MTNRNSSNRLGALDALRGLAILFVMAVHTSQWVKPSSDWLRALAGSGALGVDLFFLVSAFSLKLSYDARRNDGDSSLIAFFARRVFRIMPMLWVAMAIYIWWFGVGPRDWQPAGITLSDIVLTAAGANGWHPLTMNAIIPVGWSIGVEFSFYLIFPALAWAVRSRKIAIFGFLVALIIELAWIKWATPAYREILPDGESREFFVSAFITSSLPYFMPTFFSGFLCFFFWERKELQTIKGLLPFLFVALYCALAFRYFKQFPHASVGIVTVLFLAVMLNDRNVLLNNTILRAVGRVSYSAYLLHIMVIYQFVNHKWFIGDAEPKGNLLLMIAFVAVVSVTYVASVATFRIIEVPGQRLGTVAIGWLRSRPRVSAAGAET